MKAVILAAGKGVRMLPLTLDKPKVLIEIYGKPFLWYVLHNLEFAGFNEFIIVGHNHWAEVDAQNHFACCGAILYGFAQYLTIDSATTKITLHEEWYDR